MALTKKIFCVGLTGGIGSGKTTVANFFAQLGITVIDADVIAREVTEPGAPAYNPIVEHFGQDIVTAQGQLDRKKLRRIIFENNLAKVWLENLLHPLILRTMRERIDQVTSPYCIMVIPLLVETAFSIDFLDRICVVDAPEALRKQWAAQRDQTSPAEIEAVIAAQSARERRLALADDLIINNHDLAALETQIKKLHSQYLQMASA